MTTTPNYVSNAELAARLSALVERWALRESEMIALLTQPEGKVTLTDAIGTKYSIASYNALLSEVERMVDDLNGVTASTAGMTELARQYADRASASATTAGGHADRAAAVVASIDDSIALAEEVVADAQAAADMVASVAQGVEQNATDADEAAIRAANSASAASVSASTATTQANAARTNANTAANHAATAQQWATAPVDTEVAPGQFSAYHWANVAARAGSGALVYMGGWDASTGAFPASPTLGQFYKVTKAGTVGGVRFNIGDQAIYNGSGWDLIDNTDLVQSVNGKVGAVVLAAADISGLGALATKSKVSYTTDLTDVPATFPPSSHTHTKGDVGLANVDNTSDLNKPISTATANALAAKAPLDSPTFTTTITAPTATVGGTYLYNSGGASFSLRTGTSAGYKYFTFGDDGTIKALSGGVSATGVISTSGTSFQLLDSAGAIRGRMQHNGTNLYVASDVGDLYLRPAGYSSASGQLVLSETSGATLSGAFTASASISSQFIAGTTNNPFRLGFGGTVTHSFISWHTTGDGSTRTAFMGFGSAGAVDFQLSNERGGNIQMRASAVYVGDSGGLGLVLQPNGNLYRGDANNRANHRYQPRIFVQAGDPGAAAADNDLWIW